MIYRRTNHQLKSDYNVDMVGFMLSAIFSVPSILPYNNILTPFFFLLLTLVPILQSVIYYNHENINYSIDPVIPICIMYAIAAPLSTLFFHDETSIYWRYYSKHGGFALLMFYRGFSFFITSYYLNKMLNANLIKKKAPLQKNSDDAIEVLRFITFIGFVAIFGYIGLLVYYGRVEYAFIKSEHTENSGTIPQILTLFTLLSYPFITAYFVLKKDKIQNSLNNKIFYFLILMLFLEIIGAGSKTELFSLITCYFISLIYTEKLITLKKIIVSSIVLLIIVVSFSFVENYRNIVKYNYKLKKTQGFLDTVQFQLTCFGLAYKEMISPTLKKEDDDDVIEGAAGRLALISAFSQVLRVSNYKSPYEYPYKNLLLPLYAVSPRSIFPDKPQFFDSGKMAKKLGWKFGGYSVTLIGSLYWAWGYYGIYIGMAFLGIFFSFIATRAQINNVSGIKFLTLMVFMILNLMEVGTIFQAIVINNVRLIVLLILITLYIRVFHISFHKKLKRRVSYRSYGPK